MLLSLGAWAALLLSSRRVLVETAMDAAPSWERAIESKHLKQALQ